MAAKDTLILMLKKGGWPTLLIVSVLAAFLYEECPTPDAEYYPIVNFLSNTSFTMKNIKIGEKQYMAIRAFDSSGILSGPSEMICIYNSGVKIYSYGSNDSILYWWPMYEARGAIISSLHNGEIGVLNGPTWSVLGSDFALKFDGINDYVSLGVIDIKELPIRFEADIFVEKGCSSHARIIDKSNKNINLWMLTLYNTIATPDSFKIRMKIRTNTLNTLISNSYCIKLNTPYNIVGTYDGSSMKLYVNYEKVASSNASGVIAIDTTMTSIIGYGGHGGYPFKGKITNVIISGKTRI